MSEYYTPLGWIESPSSSAGGVMYTSFFSDEGKELAELGHVLGDKAGAYWVIRFDDNFKRWAVALGWSNIDTPVAWAKTAEEGKEFAELSTRERWDELHPQESIVGTLVDRLLS